MELWDAYTKEGIRTGETLVRGEPFPEGRYHLVCEVLVRHRDGSYLAMKRWHKKEGYPGWWETTAGGSALRGEDMYQCARREMKEETGLEGDDFIHIGCRTTAEDHVIFHSFLCTVDCDKDSVTLQECETEDYRWLTEQEFVEFANSDEMIPSQKRRMKAWLAGMGYLRTAVQKIHMPGEKITIAREILDALPEWFGIPESTENYVRESANMPFWAAYDGEKAVGFVSLKETGRATGEIFVMGVLPGMHRSGVGKALFGALEQGAMEMGYTYLQVKTVQMGKYEIYDRTNRFYLAMGFSELECFPELWGEANPCQIYVKYIGGQP